MTAAARTQNHSNDHAAEPFACPRKSDGRGPGQAPRHEAESKMQNELGCEEEGHFADRPDRTRSLPVAAVMTLPLIRERKVAAD